MRCFSCFISGSLCLHKDCTYTGNESFWIGQRLEPPLCSCKICITCCSQLLLTNKVPWCFLFMQSGMWPGRRCASTPYQLAANDMWHVKQFLGEHLGDSSQSPFLGYIKLSVRCFSFMSKIHALLTIDFWKPSIMHSAQSSLLLLPSNEQQRQVIR